MLPLTATTGCWHGDDIPSAAVCVVCCVRSVALRQVTLEAGVLRDNDD